MRRMAISSSGAKKSSTDPEAVKGGGKFEDIGCRRPERYEPADLQPLAAENYSVDSCYNGQEVLDYLECAEYDAIVLDIMMPVMNGLQVLKKLRQREDHIPVLLLTAMDSVEDRVNGLDSGADDYLVKPFAFEETAGPHPSNAAKAGFCEIKCLYRRRS